uniref:Uncharacterized protein n=1 Tax=Anguilla anguilla TaxID=7936 RepID=A0A0E9WZK4_ANGAN
MSHISWWRCKQVQLNGKHNIVTSLCALEALQEQATIYLKEAVQLSFLPHLYEVHKMIVGFILIIANILLIFPKIVSYCNKWH